MRSTRDRLHAATYVRPEDHTHRPGDGSWWMRDGYGIELCRVCDACEDAKAAKYRPDVFSAYEADESIDY
jgi:hypothetical protein